MKIALTSDIHFGSQATNTDFVVPGQKSKDRQNDYASPFFLGIINKLRDEAPDYLFISGDFTSTADPLEYKYCYEQLLRLESEAGISRNNWIACLGNHDVDRSISDLGNNGKQYSEIDRLVYSQHYMDTRTRSITTHTIIQELSKNFALNYPNSNIPMTGVVEREDCIVFVLNSGYLCTADNSGGQLAPTQFEWFRTVVEKYIKDNANNTKPKIVLLHHHPYSLPYPVPVPDLSILKEGADLNSLCGQFGIDIVIHGHRHHPIAKTVDDNDMGKAITYICAGSLSVIANERSNGAIKNCFHIIEIESSNIEKIMLKTYLYDSNDGWEVRSDRDLDAIRWFGKTVDDKAAESYIQQLPLNTALEYTSLPDELRYIPYKRLNKLVFNTHAKLQRQITGEFPNNVFIRSKEILEA